MSTPALVKIGDTDALALKLDNAGNLIWAKNFGGAGVLAAAAGIAVDAAKNVYLGGSFSGNNLTSTANALIGTNDALALKLDSGGGRVWSRNFGGNGAKTAGAAITVDSGGNVYLAGTFTSSDLTTPAVRLLGYADAFIFKLDSAGDSVWSKGFGSSFLETAVSSLAVGVTDNLYIGGSMYDRANAIPPTLPRLGITDAFASKLSKGGDAIWTKIFGGRGATTLARSIAVDAANNVYLTGSFSGANLTTPMLTRIGQSDPATFNGFYSSPTSNVFVIKKFAADVPPDLSGPVVARAGNGQATVTFGAPSQDGGSPITGYTVISNPAGGVDSNAGGVGLSHIVTGLTNGISYTFTVSATNAAGTGPASIVQSNAVTPGNASPPAFLSAASATFRTKLPNNFLLSAVGTAPVTFSSSPLPTGVTLSNLGLLSGIPETSGTFPVIITASNVGGIATQNFTLTVVVAIEQTITLNSLSAQVFSILPFPLLAGSTSGMPITFSSLTPFVCGVTGSTVSMITIGTCTVGANQAGNGAIATAAEVTQSFEISGSAPGAPTIGTVTAGNARITVAFTTPASTGGSPVTSYTARCGTFSAVGTRSPIVVGGLTNGTIYSCAVTAINTFGASPESAPATVTPNANTPLVLVGVQSRKSHGTAGPFDLAIDISQPIDGNVTVEPRLGGADILQVKGRSGQPLAQ